MLAGEFARPPCPLTLIVACPLSLPLQELASTVKTVEEAGPGSFAPLDLSSWTGAAPSPEATLDAELFVRSVPYAQRRPLQPQFPPFPTTTIGSFPQTAAIRRARLQFKKGELR